MHKNRHGRTELLLEFEAKPGGLPKNEEIVSILREGMQAKTAAVNSQGEGKHKWPPIIEINEASEYYFDSGSAVLPTKYSAHLSTAIIEKILWIKAKYSDVNVIEVIGHTDEVHVTSKTSKT